MPILVCNTPYQTRSCSPLSLEDGSQIIAAIEQCDDVWCIQLEGLPNSFLEKLETMMRETFSNLSYVRLFAAEENAPVFTEEFLGGSAPLLETLWLRGIPFPEVPKLLLSAPDLFRLQLENIPDSGFFSPEAMVTSLSNCPNLVALIIEFSSPYPHPDFTSEQNTPTARTSLPALTCFRFKGNGGYLGVLFPRIEAPLLGYIMTMVEDSFVYYEAYYSPDGFSATCQIDHLEELGEEEEAEEEEEDLSYNS